MSNIWLSVTLQNEPFCIVVHFQPVIKLLQKGVRVNHRRVILMQKCKIFLGRGTPPLQTSPPVGRRTTPPHTPPFRRLRRLDLNPSHSEILPTLL